MGFSRMALYLFSFIGIFTGLFLLIPSQFFIASFNSSVGENHAVADYLASGNITVYQQIGNDNMTYEYSSYWDMSPSEWSAGMPTDQYVEVWWGAEPILGKVLEFRHIESLWWNPASLIDRLAIKINRDPSGLIETEYIFKPDLVDNFDSSINGTVLEGRCTHVPFSSIINYNQTKYATIGDAWDGGELSYSVSYEFDPNATRISAWSVLSSLLSFQNPELGLTGDGGTILNLMIAVPLFIMVAVLLFIVVLAIIPFISGLQG